MGPLSAGGVPSLPGMTPPRYSFRSSRFFPMSSVYYHLGVIVSSLPRRPSICGDITGSWLPGLSGGAVQSQRPSPTASPHARSTGRTRMPVTSRSPVCQRSNNPIRGELSSSVIAFPVQPPPPSTVGTGPFHQTNRRQGTVHSRAPPPAQREWRSQRGQVKRTQPDRADHV